MKNFIIFLVASLALLLLNSLIIFSCSSVAEELYTLSNLSEAEWIYSFSDTLPGTDKDNGKKIVAVDGIVDVGSLYDSIEGNTSLYLQTFIVCPNGNYKFLTGSNQAQKIWIDGVLIATNATEREFDPYSDQINFNLNAGKHRIVIQTQIKADTDKISCSFEKVNDDELIDVRKTEQKIEIPQIVKLEFNQDLTIFTRSLPNSGISLPFEYTISTLDGITLETGKRMSDLDWLIGQPIFNKLSNNESKLYQLSIKILTPNPKFSLNRDNNQKDHLIQNSYIAHGDYDLICKNMALKNETAAKLIKNNADLNDFYYALLFLKDRLEQRLHPSLQRPELMDAALYYSALYQNCINTNPDSLKNLRGYLQYAYLSPLDETIQPYCLYLPKDYNPKKSYMLISNLHGKDGDDYTGARELAQLEPNDALILSLQGRGDLMYHSTGEHDVMMVIDRVCRNYAVDQDRVHLTGGSMGGIGTWYLGQMYTDTFASLIIFDGYTGTDFLNNLINLPVLAVHGEKDDSVPVDLSRAAVQKLKTIAAPIQYVELPDVGHNAWTAWTAENGIHALFTYFRPLKREMSPQKISAVIAAERYGKHYWVQITEIDRAGKLFKPEIKIEARFTEVDYLLYPKPATIEAHIINAQELHIITSKVKTFKIDLSLAKITLNSKILIKIDQQVLISKGDRNIVTMQKDQAGAWSIVNEPKKKKVVHQGAGFADIFMDSAIIVYGTQNKARVNYWKLAAQSLSDWTRKGDNNTIGSFIGSWPIKADFEVSEADLKTKHLIVLGDETENLISKRYKSSFNDFWKENSIELKKKTLQKTGLGLLVPNPDVGNNRLLGFIFQNTNFLKDSEVQYWFWQFSFRFKNIHLSEADSWPALTPDVMVFSRDALKDEHSLWWDADWQQLSGTLD